MTFSQVSKTALAPTAERPIIVFACEAKDTAFAAYKKSPDSFESGLLNLNPGGVLLSHGETPHYHRR